MDTRSALRARRAAVVRRKQKPAGGLPRLPRRIDARSRGKPSRSHEEQWPSAEMARRRAPRPPARTSPSRGRSPAVAPAVSHAVSRAALVAGRGGDRVAGQGAGQAASVDRRAWARCEHGKSKLSPLSQRGGDAPASMSSVRRPAECCDRRGPIAGLSHEDRRAGSWRRSTALARGCVGAVGQRVLPFRPS